MADDTDDLHWMSAKELALHFSRRDLSPVEVAEWHLGRIEALDAKINAFCLVDRDATIAQAEAAEERFREGEPLGPLDGVPIAVKDLLLTKGWPTLRGSLLVDRAQPWEHDAPSVARLREAGAVFLGKTTTPEFGHKATNDSPLTGVTRNPWNLDLTPGGSSGGAAAALAAGLAPLAYGTDAGGSIRIPASFCGVVGLKPTFGRVPAWPPSPFGSLAHAGPMARTVEDAALFFVAMSKDDPRDGAYAPVDMGSVMRTLCDGVAGLKVAYSPRLGFATALTPQVEAVADHAAQVLASLGAKVERVDPPLNDPTAMFRKIYTACTDLLASTLPQDKLGSLDPTLTGVIMIGAGLSRREFQAAQVERMAYTAAWRQFMTGYDLVLTPQLAVPPFPVGRIAPERTEADAWLEWSPYTFPFNLTGQPAINVPGGFTASGLPIGVQLVGRHFADDVVLRAAYALEAALDLGERRPEGF
jgi:aspartyl-tRNA(Asn)/glutamyl-tRNA(Gln) amidotransferase subunit A